MTHTLEGPAKRLLAVVASTNVKWTTVLLYVPIFLVPLFYMFRYRRSIKERLKHLEDPTEVMVRVSDPEDGMASFRVLELTPEFVQSCSAEWQLMSLGEYLSTLRPAVLPEGVDAPQFIQRELERFLAATLLNYLGPRFGAAILPILGFSNIQSTTGKLAVNVTNWFASHFIVDQANRVMDPSLDRGAFPFSFFDLSALANMNQSLREADTTISPIELLKGGEVAYSPSFADDNDLIPNPFIVEVHWEKAISGMEDLMRRAHLDISSPSLRNIEQDSNQPTREFDPSDRCLPEPTPLNQRLFPDLHIGWGSAKCTHTKREIIRNRLLAVLFNRLARNYYCKEQGIKEEFAVKFAGIHINTPRSLLWTLMETGHEVEVCPRGTITTFGMATCIKEQDGSWTHVPLSYFVRTGYESESSRPAHAGVPHGGMDLDISGPLVGNNNKCNIQFYMAIEGMCGWHSNHNADVPWKVATASTEPYTKDMALQAIRMAGLLSVTFNAIGTEQQLPFGGYGVLGVCNDTAALLDQAVRGTTNMYPLVSTGRYLMHIAKRLVALRIGLCDDSRLEEELKDIQLMVAAIMEISSDLQASPSNVVDGVRRYLACLPKTSVFQVEVESKDMLSSILHTFAEYRESSLGLETTWNWKNPMLSIRQMSPSSSTSPSKGKGTP